MNGSLRGELDRIWTVLILPFCPICLPENTSPASPCWPLLPHKKLAKRKLFSYHFYIGDQTDLVGFWSCGGSNPLAHSSLQKKV
jgi:hypothetical protein